MFSEYYREAFARISPEKQQTVLRAAIVEFADNGYQSANTNTIASRAGISVGSLFKYFGSKENLYLAVVHHAVETMKEVLEEIMRSEEDLLTRVENIIRAIQIHSRSNIHLTRLYNEITTENRSDLTMKAAAEMEQMTAGLYGSLIAEAMKEKLLRTDIDPALFAFFLDNLFMTLQFSYSCEYYRERMKIFAGVDVFDRDETVVEELMKFIRGAFGAQGA